MSSATVSFVKRASNYVFVTAGYGFVRSVTYDYSHTKEYFNTKKYAIETKQMLLTDHLGRITSRTLAAVFAWPWMLGEDLTRLECAVRGKDYAEYGVERSK
jgi:predicted patatin/cPLA2 family phospholipase